MDYKKLTPEQIYTGEVSYTLDDFAKDFRKRAEKDWGSETLEKKNKSSQTIYEGIFITVVLASQDKSTRLISKAVMGKSTKKLQEAAKIIIDMYKQEIKILRSLQMKMFLENLREYRLPDSLNLKLFNADFQAWFEKTLGLPKKSLEKGIKNEKTTKH